VKTTITFVMFGILKKYTTGGARSKFVWCYGRHVGVVLAAKDMEMLISWGCTEQAVVWTRRTDGLGGETIQQVCCCVETLNPVASW
jgi:hypothetical protein